MLANGLQADLTKKRLDRAGKLTSALADEGVRWQQTADNIQLATDLLVRACSTLGLGLGLGNAGGRCEREACTGRSAAEEGEASLGPA